MAEEYNSRSKGAGTTEIASAIQGNLLAEEPYITDSATKEKVHDFGADPRFNAFDAVIVGLGFHHFSDYSGSLKKLSQRLKSGGVVGIIDLAPSDQVSRCLIGSFRGDNADTC
jgi:hypothetical protein